MIWFFIAGWVSGAVFMVMYAKWWFRRNSEQVTPEEMINELKELENKEDESHE